MTDFFPSTSSVDQDATSLLSAIARQVALSRAARLAERGRYSEAEGLVAGLVIGGNEVVPALDLMARIRAQQGRYDEAETLWLEAARLDPEEGSYRTAITRLAKLRKRPSWGRFLFLPFPSLLVIIALLVVGFLATIMIRDLWQIPSTPDSLAAAPAEGEHPGVVEPKPAAVDLELEAAEEIRDINRARILAEIAEHAQMPGVRLEHMDGSLMATFEEGIFRESTTVVPGSATVLAALGRRLEPFVDQINIEVTGHTDDLRVKAGSVFRDNFALGFERAAAAVDYLRANADLPAELFSARTAGESQPPYSNETPAGRRRNRTVTLRISVLE